MSSFLFLGDLLVGVLVGVDFGGVFMGVLEGVEVVIPLADGGGEDSLDVVVVLVAPGWPVVWAVGTVPGCLAVTVSAFFSGLSAGVGLVAIWLPDSVPAESPGRKESV